MQPHRSLLFVLSVSAVAVACSSGVKHKEPKVDIAVSDQALLGNRSWSTRFGDELNQNAHAAAVDSTGNLLVTGEFAGSMNLGATCGTLTSAGGLDVYLIQFNSSGNCLWAKQFGDEVNQYGRAVAVDSANNVTIVGYFYGSVDFGGGPLVSPDPGTDIFVAQFDSAGNYRWAANYGDAANQYARGVAVDSERNIIVTGDFLGSVDFGAGPVTSAGGTDIFVAKFSSTGDYLWASRFGDPADQTGKAVAIDSANNVVLVGSFKGSVNFGGGDLSSTGPNDSDIFVAKLNSNGEHLWSRKFGDSSNQYGEDVAVDSTGNVAAVGTFAGTVNFGGAPLSTTGPADSDVFVVKFTSTGDHSWSKKFGDSANQFGTGISIDVSNNVLLTGYFYGNIDFGGGPLPSAGLTDVFLAKFDPAGRFFGGRRFGDANYQFGEAVLGDAAGNVWLIGQFLGTIDFGPPTLIHTSAGGTDVFIAKFDRGCDSANCPGCCDGPLCRASSFGTCGVNGATCVACDSVRANVCTSGSCGCGSQGPCANGLHCVGGTCVCDSTGCPGCCNGGPTGSCNFAPGMTSCRTGSSDVTCHSCITVPPTADNCTSQGCRCGSGGQCAAGQYCSGGSCRCDSSSCHDGCCDGNNVCQPGTQSATCGHDGQACGSCGGAAYCSPIAHGGACQCSLCGSYPDCHACSCEQLGQCGVYPSCHECSCGDQGLCGYYPSCHSCCPPGTWDCCGDGSVCCGPDQSCP